MQKACFRPFFAALPLRNSQCYEVVAYFKKANHRRRVIPKYRWAQRSVICVQQNITVLGPVPRRILTKLTSGAAPTEGGSSRSTRCNHVAPVYASYWSTVMFSGGTSPLLHIEGYASAIAERPDGMSHPSNGHNVCGFTNAANPNEKE